MKLLIDQINVLVSVNEEAKDKTRQKVCNATAPWKLFSREFTNSDVSTFEKETSDQRNELVVCTESESQGFPVGEEGTVNCEEEQPEKIEFWKFKTNDDKVREAPL